MGYRSAVASIGTTSPTVAESVLWLNALLNQVWRVHYDPMSLVGRKFAKDIPRYPKFVTRAAEMTKLGRRDRTRGPFDSLGLLPYSGLEPYISSSIGESLLTALESSKASRPSDIAYVSLHSLTLGSTPPLIRSIELHGVKQGGEVTQYLVDVDAVLDDFSLVVGKLVVLVTICCSSCLT